MGDSGVFGFRLVLLGVVLLAWALGLTSLRGSWFKVPEFDALTLHLGSLGCWALWKASGHLEDLECTAPCPSQPP